MRQWWKWLLGGLTLMLLATGGLAGGAWYFVETPLRPADNATVVFTVESGESLASVAGRLEKNGLVRWSEGFRTYARLRKVLLQAGEFELSAGWSPRRILETLAFGQPMLHRLHFAEGLTMREVALAVNATGLTTAERFLAACRDKDFLRKNGIPAENAEGYLFPETYFFPRIPGQSPYPILKALLDRFKGTVRDLPQAGNPEELHAMVILASLVEKETAIPAERKLVAGVYARRLQLGMLLQCDPTIIYGLGEAFTGNLRRSHLQDAANPYNTYVHPGLPPGPICSPGKAALMAAAGPAEHEFLYFVARPDGSHHFSRSLNEHNNAVIKYQRGGRPFPKSRGPES
ncbi:MAG: endolytic transglycosylase MltG [Pseudomonadota bacterium]|nr:endolytic transglycosylase MltG [Pseudomonadota bacterium]